MHEKGIQKGSPHVKKDDQVLERVEHQVEVVFGGPEIIDPSWHERNSRLDGNLHFRHGGREEPN